MIESLIEVEFEDGYKLQVAANTASVAKVKAAYARMLSGAESHKELSAVSAIKVASILTMPETWPWQDIPDNTPQVMEDFRRTVRDTIIRRENLVFETIEGKKQ